MAPPRKSESSSLIGWTTITYRSVLLGIAAVLFVVLVAVYFIFPEASKSVLQKVQNAVAEQAAKLGIGNPPVQQAKAGPQQANFTALEGTVRVKKATSNSWINADSNTALDKGDVVQTAADGIARIVFADGSSYLVKPDSLIVIEENSMNNQQQTNVSVQVTTGTVDLATATYTSGSHSGVTVAGATATFAPDSAAQVRSDPKGDDFGVLVKKGAGEVARNGEKVALTDYDLVTFNSTSAKMEKSKEIAPPTLIAPANMLPLFTGSAQAKTVDFSWAPVKGARIYHIKVSKNSFFSSTVLDKKVPAAEFHAAGLPEGAYYWLVQSIDDKNKESVESEKNRFTIVPKAAEGPAMALELQPFIQHGRIIEVTGKTDSGARVMVNGAEANVEPDGSFRYFSQPLPAGETLITVTVQNTHGGVRTQQKKVVIQ